MACSRSGERFTATATHVPVKADSHIACRSHAVPLPCRAAKGLECVFQLPEWSGTEIQHSGNNMADARVCKPQAPHVVFSLGANILGCDAVPHPEQHNSEDPKLCDRQLFVCLQKTRGERACGCKNFG